jgi:prepilin-type N-terminal cleavage/methylation domain-containing protein
MKNADGFTLIELLVVVLIIGILAAIALPQYTKSILRTRTVQAVSMLKSLKDAQEIFFLQNGEYTSDLDKLDIDVPQELRRNGGNVNSPNTYYFECSLGRICRAHADNPNLPLFEFTGRNDNVHHGKNWCIVNSKTEMARSLCESLGRLDSFGSGNYYIIN